MISGIYLLESIIEHIGLIYREVTILDFQVKKVPQTLRRSQKIPSCCPMVTMAPVSPSRSTLAVSSSRSLPMQLLSSSASSSPLAASPPSPFRSSPPCPRTPPGPAHSMSQLHASSSSMLVTISADSSLVSSSGPNLARLVVSSPSSFPSPGLCSSPSSSSATSGQLKEDSLLLLLRVMLLTSSSCCYSVSPMATLAPSA